RCPAHDHRVRRSLPLICVAWMATVRPPELLAAVVVVAAGRRVLQVAELGEVAGVHRASAVRFTSAHSPLLRTCQEQPSLDPQLVLRLLQKQVKGRFKLPIKRIIGTRMSLQST
ncbi:hypothetical protein GOODEAATRI_010487, partial [Goodea atripinnis]